MFISSISTLTWNMGSFSFFDCNECSDSCFSFVKLDMGDYAYECSYCSDSCWSIGNNC